MPPTFLGSRVSCSAYWAPILSPCFLDELRCIERDLRGVAILPPPAAVLGFFQMSRVKGVILGQDPYSTPGKATGRAFEIGGLRSWQKCQSDSALEILKALHRLSTGRTAKATKARILRDHKFVILPPDQLFKHWENEGILLLNTALTCAPRRAGSHLTLWAPVINRIIRFVRAKTNPPHWFLWGPEAQAYEIMIPSNQTIHREVHPNLQGKKSSRSFGNTAACFSSGLIDWYGRNANASPITDHSEPVSP